MRNQTFSYKNYTGSIEISVEDSCLHGEILFINDIITYEGVGVEELRISFNEAVDRYISYCEETGKPANKPYSGTFNVRIGSELHRKASKQACLEGKNLNEFVTHCIQKNLCQDEDSTIKHEHHHTHEIIYKDDPGVNVASGINETWNTPIESKSDTDYYDKGGIIQTISNEYKGLRIQ